MAEAHKGEWADIFAQMLQQVLDKLISGETNSLSMLMENEKHRVLKDVPFFGVPPMEDPGEST